MTNGQKIAIGAGVLLAFGVGYYIYRKMKMPAGEAGADTGSGGGGGGGGSLSEAKAVTAGRTGASAVPSAAPSARTISPSGAPTPTGGWSSTQRGGGTVVRPSAPVLRVTPVAPRPVTRPTTTISR